MVTGSAGAEAGGSWSVPQRQPKDATRVQTVHAMTALMLDLMASDNDDEDDDDDERLDRPTSLSTSAHRVVPLHGR